MTMTKGMKKKKKYVRPTITVVPGSFDITMDTTIPVCSQKAKDEDLMGKQTSFDDWEEEDEGWLRTTDKVRKSLWE